MGFGTAVKTGFSKYATFSGRARRSEFWWFQLFLFLVTLPFSVFFLATYVQVVVALVEAEQLGADPLVDGNWAMFGLSGLLLLVVSLALLLPTYAVWARRLHDMGQTGHWLWLNLVSLGIVPFIMAFLDSQPGENRWGPNPKGVAGYGAPAYPAYPTDPSYPAAPTYPAPPSQQP
ncbi:DUF805 domain-containing protein [Demequina sp.]|uniref:DUF805 domain-containing protein n=1 Tax=Demequina sp. TaxID=2050685 RepID=UPI003A8C4D5A